MSAETHSVEPDFVGSDRYIDAKTFFDEIIRSESGEISEPHLYAELSDYLWILRQVPQVYSYFTCGLLSKPGYHAVDVINIGDECANNQIADIVQDVLNRIEAGESVADIRNEFPASEERI